MCSAQASRGNPCSSRPSSPPPTVRTLTANPHILSSETVRDLAIKHGRSEAQVFYRFLTQLGIVPLNGTTSLAHMREDLDIFSFALDMGDMGDILRLMGF